MPRAAALCFAAVIALLSLSAHAEPGTSTPVVKPSAVFQTAMPDDDDTIVRPAPPATQTPSASPSPSASPNL